MNRRIEEDVMKIRLPAVFLFTSCLLLFTSHLSAQDLGPQFKKIKDGIFVYAGIPNESNCTIILTHEGVVLIYHGNTPLDSQTFIVRRTRRSGCQRSGFFSRRRPLASSASTISVPSSAFRIH